MFNAPWILPFGRFFVGVLLGICLTVAPVYLNEIAPVGLKGAFGVSFQAGCAFGFCVATVISLPQVLGSYELWPWLFLTAGFPVIYILILGKFCLESPGWLLKEGKVNEAIKAIQAIHGEDKNLNDIEVLAETDKSMNEVIVHIFKTKPLRRSVLVGCIIMTILNYGGVNSVFQYSTQTFINAGIPAKSADYCTIGLNFMNFSACILSTIVIERTGRRLLMLVGLFGMFVMNVLNCVLYGYSDNPQWAFSVSNRAQLQKT